MTSRPLSPHLGIYRRAYTMVLSILHRATGIALSAGLLVLVCWLWAVASGEPSLNSFNTVMDGMPLQLLLAAWLMAFLYHLANGIRHLFWDAGWGLEKAQARRSGVAVVVAVVLATALLLWAFFLRVKS
jgi:succinate dehydrogenase / fumarate reductase cytochrome b subunit